MMGWLLLVLDRAVKVVFPLLGRLLRLLRPLAPWILTAALGALVVWFLPVVGFGAQIVRAELEADTWKQAAADWRRSSNGWESSFRSSEATRKKEQGRAVEAVDIERRACNAEVAEARRSARVIEKIVTKEPTYDANRCPVRELVDPDRLREALDARPD